MTGAGAFGEMCAVVQRSRHGRAGSLGEAFAPRRQQDAVQIKDQLRTWRPTEFDDGEDGSAYKSKKPSKSEMDTMPFNRCASSTTTKLDAAISARTCLRWCEHAGRTQRRARRPRDACANRWNDARAMVSKMDPSVSSTVHVCTPSKTSWRAWDAAGLQERRASMTAARPPPSARATRLEAVT